MIFSQLKLKLEIADQDQISSKTQKNKILTIHALSHDSFLSTLKKYYYFQHIIFLRPKRRILGEELLAHVQR